MDLEEQKTDSFFCRFYPGINQATDKYSESSFKKRGGSPHAVRNPEWGSSRVRNKISMLFEL
jgi:hypothetical protein